MIVEYSRMQVYPSQTKILEGLTKEEIRISKEALFKGVSTRFALRTILKGISKIWISSLVPPSKIFVWGEHKLVFFHGPLSLIRNALGRFGSAFRTRRLGGGTLHW
jgi:hypothetical protein